MWLWPLKPGQERLCLIEIKSAKHFYRRLWYSTKELFVRKCTFISFRSYSLSLCENLQKNQNLKRFSQIKLHDHDHDKHMTMTWHNFHEVKTPLALSNCSLIMQFTHSPCHFWEGASLGSCFCPVVLGWIRQWSLPDDAFNERVGPPSRGASERHHSLWDFSNNFYPPPKGWKQLKATVAVQPLIFSGQDNIPTAEQRQRAFTDKTLFWKRLCKTKSEAKSRVKQPSGV